MSDVGVQETAKAYAAYTEYCALGPTRSLRKLAEKRDENGTKTGQIFKQLGIWSSLYNWQERVKQYDVERAEEKRIARELAREEMNARHAKEAKEDQELSRKELKLLAEKHKIGSIAAVQLLKNAVEAERKALGADENILTGAAKVEVDASQDRVKVVVYYPRLDEQVEADDGSD